MDLLVACEFTGIIRDAFRARGHNAYSCDLLPSENGSRYHYQTNVVDLLHLNWDMLIAHPPCTFLSNSGSRWLHEREHRWKKMDRAARFFKLLMEADIPKVAIENPIPHKYALKIIGKRHDQIIHPWQFGHRESKSTCLWLKGLPPLLPTKIIMRRSEKWDNQTPSGQNKLSESEMRGMLRSRTYQGIAEAMAKQWG